MKTFKDYLNESKDETFDIQSLLNESHDLTEEQEATIDATVDRILEAHKEGKNLEDCVEEIVNEGLLGSIFGGLKGFHILYFISKVLGIQKGALYDLLTSRLVGAALGAVLGKRI